MIIGSQVEAAVTERVRELDGEVLRIFPLPAIHDGRTATGTVAWKSTRKPECVTHRYYVRDADEPALLEGGDYHYEQREADCVAAAERRARS